NQDRFPADFMFELSREEYNALRRQFGTFKRGEHSKYLPYAFTEQGVSMLSSVLRSTRAVQVNIEIMRAFVRLRELMVTHKDLVRRLNEMENKYDAQFKVVFDAIRELMTPPESKKRKIGFLVKERAARYGRGLSCHFHVFGIAKTWKCVSERVVKPRQITGISHFDVLRIIKTWKFRQKRDDHGLYDVVTSFLRSGTSVGAHFREAQRAKSNPDFMSKMEGGMQKIEETIYWLELLEG